MSDESEPPPQEVPNPEAAEGMAEASAGISSQETETPPVEAPGDELVDMKVSDNPNEPGEAESRAEGEVLPESADVEGDGAESIHLDEEDGADQQTDSVWESEEPPPEGEPRSEMKQEEGEADEKGEGEEGVPEGEEAPESDGTAEGKEPPKQEETGEGEEKKGEEKKEGEEKTEGEEKKEEGEKPDHEEEDEEEEKEEEEEQAPPETVAPPKGGGKRRQSIGYHAATSPASRIADDVFDMIPQIGGDFHATLDEDRESFDFEAYEPEEPEYELHEEEEKEEVVPEIDRPMYYELYKVYDKQVHGERTRNLFLQRRMTDYFKRRRMLHVLRESMYESDTQAKYERKLDALDHLLDISTQETERINAEVFELRKKRDDKRAELDQFFNKMQKKELAIGQDLLNNKGPKYNLEKVVEQYLKHQRTHIKLMIKMRLAYIKIRDRVFEKQAELKALDNLGDNLHLIDYEQLKMDVRNNSDKLEEKDGELSKLREQCKNSMQILAHFREKSGAIDADIDMYNDRLDEIVREHDDIREQLLYLKQERDNFRACTNKLRTESGLLTKPILLRDMEDSLNEVKSLTDKLQNTKDQFSTFTNQVKAVRKHIENIKEKREEKRQSSETALFRRASVASRASRLSRPSISGPRRF